ncbi:MAG: hypothetical protein IMZ63_03505 [Actinobacteria bacterium]|nr:hypothetical protein [Actinomycetota bacterium]
MGKNKIKANFSLKESFKKEIDMKHKVTAFSLVCDLLLFVPSKDILKMMHFYLLRETSTYLYSMAALLASKEDEERIETMRVLTYILKHWDALLKKAKREKIIKE